MKRCHHVLALLDPNRIALIPGNHLGRGTRAANNRRANENGLHFAVPLHRHLRNTAIDLTPVSVTLDSNIHGLQTLLTGTGYIIRQQNCARASPEHRLLVSELLERLEQILHIEQLEHRSAFAAGNDQPVDLVQVVGGANFNRSRSGTSHRFPMSLKIPLQRQYADGFHSNYHPRVCSNSLSGSFETSKPRIASPSS